MNDQTRPDSAEPKMGYKAVSAGLGRGVQAGLTGEELNWRGVMQAVGGLRGIIEAVLPGLLFIITFVFTGDATVSVIAPAIVAAIAIVLRLVAKDSLITALSGGAGVAIAVFTTLFTGKGEDYFLPGFWINAVWSFALLISLLLRWPLIGFLAGLVRNDLTGWRKEKQIYSAAWLATVIWLGMFVLRLVVQLPLYFAGNVAALGIARIAMGTPLFAIVVIFTWLLFSKHLSKTREESDT